MDGGHGINTNWVDDIALNDTAGGADDSWCGNGHIIALVPNGAVSAQWTPSAGANYQCVDERGPNDDTDYVYASGSSFKDVYDFSACGLSNVSISRVWTQWSSRKTNTSDPIKSRTLLNVGGVDYDDADAVAEQTSYKHHTGDDHTVKPGTTDAWTTTDLDALRAGPKVD